MYNLKRAKILRFFINFFRIPYNFIFLRGHVYKKGVFSVDANGRYVPWLTYPFVDFIENLKLSDCVVFEYGAGSSSLWWSSRVKSVCSVEMDSRWAEFIEEKLPNNSQLILCEDGGQYPISIDRFDRQFDIIVVDGAERYKSAKYSINKLTENGIIVVDNTDWYPNTAFMLRNNGFTQLDFYGFSPNNSFPSITSLFYKNDYLLRQRNELHPVVGGNLIPGGVLDDFD